MKPLSCVKSLGMGNSLMTLSFSGSVWIPFRLITCPRNGSSSLKKKYFSGLSFRPAFSNRSNTCSRWHRCLSNVFDPTLISSMYTTTNCHNMSLRTVSISLWKVAGALQRPKGIMVNSYVPKRVIKVDFSLSFGSSSTC
jgi:hypothetical protein